MNPDNGSSPISAGLVRFEPNTTACQRPFNSNTSIFCPTASATYNLSPIQSTAIATGAQVPGSVMSLSGILAKGFVEPRSCCECI